MLSAPAFPNLNPKQRRCFASAPPRGARPSLPEFDLSHKTILVTGAARGLGLCMAQALLEAGAKVYALDRLPPTEQSPDFDAIQRRASEDWGTELVYKQIDVRDVDGLNEIVRGIADESGRMDGLIAAAGIQQETAALEYKQEDANRMFEVSLRDVFVRLRPLTRWAGEHHWRSHDCPSSSPTVSTPQRILAICPQDLLDGFHSIHVRLRRKPWPLMPRLQRFQSGRSPISAKSGQ